MWEPRRLTTLWASTACHGDSFTLFTFTLRCFHVRVEHREIGVTKHGDDSRKISAQFMLILIIFHEEYKLWGSLFWVVVRSARNTLLDWRFWVVKPCISKRSRDSAGFLRVLLFCPEVRGDIFRRNVELYPIYTTFQRRNPYSSLPITANIKSADK
jgi:hypothetical protein